MSIEAGQEWQPDLRNGRVLVTRQGAAGSQWIAVEGAAQVAWSATVVECLP